MQKNVGTIDRVIRIVIGLVLIAYALNWISPDTGYNVWGWIGLLPLVTGLIGYCPPYHLLGISTRKGDKKPA